MITARIWNKIYHLTLTALPHYRVKYEKVQFGKKARIFYLFLIMRKAVTIFNESRCSYKIDQFTQPPTNQLCFIISTKCCIKLTASDLGVICFPVPLRRTCSVPYLRYCTIIFLVYENIQIGKDLNESLPNCKQCHVFKNHIISEMHIVHCPAREILAVSMVVN